MENREVHEGEVLSCRDVSSRRWRAWVEPGVPISNILRAVGEVSASNPGVEAILLEAPQSTGNPRALVLALYLYQRPGVWDEIETWIPTSYHRVLEGEDFLAVEIYCRDRLVTELELELELC